MIDLLKYTYTGIMMNSFFMICSVALATSAALFAQNAVNQSSPLVVIMLGPPGSGKGTQAVELSKDLKLPHISTGDLFRENISKNTELGKLAKGYMDQGKLVPDEVVLNMLKDRVSRSDSSNGYILDGFPRTIPQADAFGQMLSSNTKLVVLDLQVPDEVLVKRTVGRRTCKGCGQIYNIYFSPPNQENVCDKCGSELTQRSDDREDVVQERLKVYHAQTKPLIEYYEKKGVIHHVDGTQSPEKVNKALREALP